MNARERFYAVMHYLPRDRSPIMDFGFWDETLVIWQKQGLPAGVDPDTFFGMDPQWIVAPINVHLSPGFHSRVLEDRGETEIVLDSEGVTKEQGKFLGSIPRQINHTLKDRESWEKEFRGRLNGASPERYPSNWKDLIKKYSYADREYPLGINVGSLYGWIRNWMGMENLSMLVYDDRKLFEEMVETVTDCVIGSITPALTSGIHFDYALMWEDMCYRAGPLLSPTLFKKILVPNYKRITGLLQKYGVDRVVVDCDGDINLLLPLWLEAGVNTMFPIEVGVWNADPVAYRKQYGKELLIIGGVSKRLLSGSQQGIVLEVQRLIPLVEEGGFIPTPDHRVPPDVSLENYLFYLKQARHFWGKDLSSLRNMGQAEQNTSEKDAERYNWHLGD